MDPQTIQAQTAPPISQSGDIFDQLASGQSAPATSAQPTTAPAPATSQSTAPTPAAQPAQPQSGSGDIFDQLATNPNSMAGNAPTATTAPTAPQTGLQHGFSVPQCDTDPDGSWYPELGNLMSGAVKSASNGLAGIIDWINKPKGQLLQTPDPESIKASIAFYRRIHPEASQQQAIDFVQRGIDAGRQPFSSTVQDLSDWLHSAGQPEGFWQNVGSIGEQALEWIGLDGLTKLASAPAKAAAAGKVATGTIDTVAHAANVGTVAKVLQENPRLAGIVSIGLKAAKDAVQSGAQQYFHSDDNPTQATESGLIAGTLSTALHGGSALVNKGIQAIRAATDTQAVNDALNNTIRTIVGNVATANGVPQPASSSVRDVFSELGDHLAQKAQTMYRQIDQALTTEGGTVMQNYKTFDQQIKNVRREISLDTGIDPDKSGALLEREAQLVDAKQQAMDLAASKGVPWDTGFKADQIYKSSKALQDVQKALNQSVTGLRPELAGTGTAATNAATTAAPETVSQTQALAKKLNTLYTSGRLSDAVGSEHADNLLRAAEIADLQAKRIAANSARLKTILKTAGPIVLGAGGYEAAKAIGTLAGSSK